MMSSADPSLAQAVEEAGYLRFHARGGSGASPQCEWMHFVVRSPDADLIVNFSVIERASHGGRAVGTLVLLLCDRTDGAHGWEGDIDEHALAPADLGAGRIRLNLGESSLAYEGGFRIRARCRRRALSVDLFLAPRSVPFLVHNVSLEPASVIHWAVVPRLDASGEIRCGARALRFERASAYHDHNWGRFSASTLTWEWGCTLPDASDSDALSAVVVRIMDRTRTHATAQALLLWQGAHRRRVFRNREVSFRSEGYLRTARAYRVPRAMSLLAPGAATDVPARLHVRAARAGDAIDAVFESGDAARVMVPRETDLGTTIIHEVTGTLRLRGALGGQPVSLDAPAFFEFMGESA